MRWRESTTIAAIRAFTIFSSSPLWIGDKRKTPCVIIKPVQLRVFHLLQLDKVGIRVSQKPKGETNAVREGDSAEKRPVEAAQFRSGGRESEISRGDAVRPDRIVNFTFWRVWAKIARSVRAGRPGSHTSYLHFSLFREVEFLHQTAKCAASKKSFRGPCGPAARCGSRAPTIARPHRGPSGMCREVHPFSSPGEPIITCGL